MIVWGGCRSNTSTDFLNTGGRYTPADDHWSTTLADGSTPSRRRGPSGVHTGEAMLVWGGLSTTAAQLPTGGAYCSVTCDLGTFYRDADSDGHGDAGDSVAACNLPPGYSAAGDDCVDQDAQAWNTPGEARDLLLSGIGDLAWSPPTAPGGAWLLYDVVRSTDRADFVNAGVCLASGLSETTMSDSDVPALGNAFYYLVRAVGGCPAGTGIFGTASNGTPVAGPACP
jgi:hypothetical protein